MQGLFGLFRFLAGKIDGVVDGAALLDHLHDEVDLFQATVLDDVAETGALFRGGLFQGFDQWQGWFAFGQVVADVLADLVVIRLVVQGVVHQLEGDTQMQTIVG
ncbi:MAG: hypothetical protein P8171_22525 [Candidatus Thiodiazotropha sp.]